MIKVVKNNNIYEVTLISNNSKVTLHSELEFNLFKDLLDELNSSIQKNNIDVNKFFENNFLKIYECSNSKRSKRSTKSLISKFGL